MHARHLATIALLALVTSVAAAQLPSTSQSTSKPRLAMHVPVPPAVVMADGVHRLLYEVHVENRSGAAVTLSSLDIHTTQTDAVNPALRLDGDRLIRALDAPIDRQAPLAIAAGSRRVVYVDIGETSRPRVLRHVLRATTAASPAAGATAATATKTMASSEVVASETLTVTVDPAPPVVLGPPLAGGPWAAVHHSDWERGHRRVFYTVEGITRLPGRYTIDFVKLDDAGRTARGDDDAVVESLGYGADVLAVSDATVAAIRDDMTEVARVSARVKHRQEDAAGNFVSLDLGNGRFAVYEHLKPRSIRVRAGQRVRRGEVIGQLGFTGDSTGPHLHLHVGDAAPPLAAEGRPFVFDRFDVLGRYADIAAMGKARWQPDSAGRRQNERPGSNTVIDFGPQR
jgi:murein DD-endopeptidase